jgi:hypothetical protein
MFLKQIYKYFFNCSLIILFTINIWQGFAFKIQNAKNQLEKCPTLKPYISVIIQHGIPTTRHGKLVTATIGHILLISYKTICHMLKVCYKKMCHMPHRNSLQYLSKNGHFNDELSHLLASK